MKRLWMLLAAATLLGSLAGCCWRPRWCDDYYQPYGYAPPPGYAPTTYAAQPCECH